MNMVLVNTITTATFRLLYSDLSQIQMQAEHYIDLLPKDLLSLPLWPIHPLINSLHSIGLTAVFLLVVTMVLCGSSVHFFDLKCSASYSAHLGPEMTTILD